MNGLRVNVAKYFTNVSRKIRPILVGAFVKMIIKFAHEKLYSYEQIQNCNW